MNARWFMSLAAPGAVAVAGCGEGPSARFVVSERTKKLTPTARTAVEGELQKSFGDPNHLVAWPKLPVDFGEFEGVVEADPQNSTDAFKVKLTQKPKSVVDYQPEHLSGAALVWSSGEYAGNDLVTPLRGKDVPFSFQVSSYDPKTSELKVRVLPSELTGGITPPKKGDKFTVLGPVLQHGRKLYMQNCEHCHGVSGDGAGPTAEYFDIKPRDYRQGLFKFTSTRNMDKARRDDLDRTVRYGIPGTYMPSFLLFKDDELGAIVEYIRWLSMRGEFEQKVDIEFEAEQYTSDAITQRKRGVRTRRRSTRPWPHSSQTTCHGSRATNRTTWSLRGIRRSSPMPWSCPRNRGLPIAPSPASAAASSSSRTSPSGAVPRPGGQRGRSAD